MMTDDDPSPGPIITHAKPPNRLQSQKEDEKIPIYKAWWNQYADAVTDAVRRKKADLDCPETQLESESAA